MTTIPAISNFYKGIADDIRQQVPREYSPLEVAAACSKIAQRLAGDAVPDRSHYREAARQYIEELPSDSALANEIIKADAGEALGIPQLGTDYAKLQAAREALAAAEAAVWEAEAMEGKRIIALRQLGNDIFRVEEQLAGWDRDWDGIIERAETCISENFGKTGAESIYSDQHVNVAFEDIGRVAILRRLAPTATERLKAQLAALKAEQDALRAAAPEPKPEPVKLTRGRIKLDAEPELANSN